MSDRQDDIPDEHTDNGGVQDDFSQESNAEGEERRLHLRAFDYWHSLKGDQEFPLFSDLTPDGLAPFRNNSLLLEFTEEGATVRYIGNNVGLLVEEPIQKGANLGAFPESTFAQALLSQFEHEDGRARAAEFEFVEDLLNCRGIMMPFSRSGLAANFAMVVVNFRRREDIEQSDTYDLSEAVGACKRAAKNVAHLDGGSRSSLYQALAAALSLYEVSLLHPDAYDDILRQSGLKAQVRAPYTPALKLTFGKNYDKTRLTEYAAALSYASRQGVAADGLADFLENEPGGIKGCVRRERSARRGQVGSAAERRQAEAEALTMAAQTVSLDDLQSDTEFSLVITRRKEGGGLEAVGIADAGKNTVDAIIRRFADEIK